MSSQVKFVSPCPQQQFTSPAKVRRPSGHRGISGMTLLELTVVISVLILLVSVLFFGATAWKRGTDRAVCIINIQNVQKAVRSYSNLNGYAPGVIVPNLKTQVIGVGRFLGATPVCPGKGIYSFGTTAGSDLIPPIGELYMKCSLPLTEQHEPADHDGW